MGVNVETIVRSVAAALEAYQAISDAADAIADSMTSTDQAELKRKLADLRAANDAARERRRDKLAKAAAQ